MLCKIYEKCTIDGYYYLKGLYSKADCNNPNSIKLFFNYLSQIIYKLYFMQKKYNFSHSDLKPNNTMGFYVDNKIIRYNIICEKETIDFKLSNFGIDWVFIDFGFSSLTINDKYIKSNAF